MSNKTIVEKSLVIHVPENQQTVSVRLEIESTCTLFAQPHFWCGVVHRHGRPRHFAPVNEVVTEALAGIAAVASSDGGTPAGAAGAAGTPPGCSTSVKSPA